MNYRNCQYCGKSISTPGIGTHEKACKKNQTKTEPPVIVTREYLQSLLGEADRLKTRAAELEAFVQQLENYPYDKLDGFVLMIAKKN